MPDILLNWLFYTAIFFWS